MVLDVTRKAYSEQLDDITSKYCVLSKFDSPALNYNFIGQ